MKIVPQATHHYYKVPSLEKYNEWRLDGTIDSAYEAKHFSLEISEMISEWMGSF